MTYRGPWNAAGLRHRQTPRRYKPVAPIGEPQDFATPEMRARSRARYATSIYLETGHVSTCAHCGYHVCSCSDGPLTLDKAISRAKAGERQAEAHRASMQPQGGTAASTCNHSGIGLLGCEVCDPLAKVRQASERASGRSASSGIMFEGKSIAVGDVLLGWSGCEDGDIVWTVTHSTPTAFTTVRNGGYSVTWSADDLSAEGMLKRRTGAGDR